MKFNIVILFVFLFGITTASTGAMAQNSSENADVRIVTEYGTMLVKLYEDTPQHRKNFLKLVSESFYDSLLFHRVISGFMIQGGDPDSRNAPAGTTLGNGSLDYLIPAEILPNRYHKKGALAAARQSDEVNPEKKSSACQFYIVQGKINPPNILESIAERRNNNDPINSFTYSEEAVEDYRTIGGAPHLDGGYTVFGEVVEGLEVIDKIAALEVDSRSRPLADVIMKIELIN